MINQLLPSQIASMWDVLSWGIERALPPVGAPDRLSRLLDSLLAGRMQCWLTSSVVDDRSQLEAVVVTQIIEDEGSGERSLLVYSLYGFRPLSNWKSDFESMGRWARAQRCTRLLAYTNSHSVIEMVKQLGGAADYTLVSIPLNGGGS